MVTLSDDTTLIEIEETADTDWGDMVPRIQQTATLDGGSVISHYGFSHSDRKFQIVAEMTRAEVAILQGMIEDSTLFYLSCDEGYFSGVISRFVPGNGMASITFLVQEKLTS
jgi:hypothetical protein